MKCKSTLSGSRMKRLCIDCTECNGGGSLDSPRCMNSALGMLKKSRVDEIKFVKKDFSELYVKREVDLLSELVDTVKFIEETHIWDSLKCEVKEDEERYKKFIQETIALFYSNPVKAYSMLEGVMNQYKEEKARIDDAMYKYKCHSNRDKLHGKDVEAYLLMLSKIKEAVEKTGYIRLCGEGKIKENMKPVVQPTFIPSYINLTIPENAHLMDYYKVVGSDIRIYEKDGEKIYFVNAPEVWLYPDQVNMLVKLNEYLSREHSLEVFDPTDAREYFRRVATDNLPKIAPGLSKEDMAKMVEIFTRYSAGYGLLEILFRDKHIFDIYIDSPPGSVPIYINHEKYGSCLTNIYLTEEDMQRLSSKFRAISERPFDEANPILDMDLRDVGIRVAGLQEPSTFDGLAYAFRKHRPHPWTLPKFVERGMMTSRTAALLSFLISGHCAMLLTGARGAGKTSLLSALMAEIDMRDRIILMEDTAEIPSHVLREKGWKIEHMKNQAVLAQKKGYELAPEENLRAALRLGESVLVLGEVRGPEARVLFEAMRVGAAGNSVLGTIHGSSPFDTWDRITNDLGVPPSSFKAVDIIVSLRYREGGGEAGKMRRVMEVTEVRKKWVNSPEHEGGFFDLMKFNEETKKEELNLRDSEILKDLCRKKSITYQELEEMISAREKMINDMVRASLECEEAVEIDSVREANRKYRTIQQKSGVDGLYDSWKEWFTEYVQSLRPHKAPVPEIKIAAPKPVPVPDAGIRGLSH